MLTYCGGLTWTIEYFSRSRIRGSAGDHHFSSANSFNFLFSVSNAVKTCAKADETGRSPHSSRDQRYTRPLHVAHHNAHFRPVEQRLDGEGAT